MGTSATSSYRSARICHLFGEHFEEFEGHGARLFSFLFPSEDRPLGRADPMSELVAREAHFDSQGLNISSIHKTLPPLGPNVDLFLSNVKTYIKEKGKRSALRVSINSSQSVYLAIKAGLWEEVGPRGDRMPHDGIGLNVWGSILMMSGEQCGGGR